MIPIRFVLYFSALAAMSAAAPAQDAPLKIEPRPAPVPVSPAMLNAKLAEPLPADQAAMKAHVLFLASDAMKGREAGSPEYDIAAQYVASRFYAAGLRPGGDAGGYLQKVPLVAYRSAGEGDLVWLAGGREDPVRLIFGEDYVPSANPASVETSINAPVVFVGYGIDAPQYKHNDYRRIDVRGKIVAFFSGAPARFGGEERAFFGSARTKAAIAAGKGAAGTITIDSPGSRRPFRGWSRISMRRGSPGQSPMAPARAMRAARRHSRRSARAARPSCSPEPRPAGTGLRPCRAMRTQGTAPSR